MIEEKVTVLFGDQPVIVRVGEQTGLAAAAAAAAIAAAASVSDDLSTLQQGLMADAWVDSESGSDSATGLSRPRAKATFAAVAALFSLSVSSLALAFDTHWRETLTLDDDYEVVASGTGTTPLIDGSDIVTGWTAHATEANVWEKSVTIEGAGNSTARGRVFIDDVQLAGVADAAAVSATANSFERFTVGANGSGTTFSVTVRIHSVGNPDTLGLRVEVTTRECALVAEAGTSVAVRGPLHVRRAIGNNGALYCLGEAQVSQVLSSAGTKHGALMGWGLTSDTIVWDLDPPTAAEASNTHFVAYLEDPTGKDAVWQRCIAHQSIETGTALSGHVAFFAHGGVMTPINFATTGVRQCAATGLTFGGAPGGGDDQFEEGCHWAGLSAVSGTGAYTVRYTSAHLPRTIGGIAALTNTLTAQDIADSCYWLEARGASDPSSFQIDGDAGGAHAAVIDHADFVMGTPTQLNAQAFAGGTATSGTFTCNYAVIAGFTGNMIALPTGVDYFGDHNVFWYANEFVPSGEPAFVHHGVGKTTLAAWQTASGEDANSCYVKTADQVAGGAYALYAGWAEAEAGTDLNTVGPAIGDFRKNAGARVYDAAGTAFIGTFPDDTPITDAGSQRHWDWNRREAVGGPRTAWPVLPTGSIGQADNYIRNPRRWAFA